MRILRAAVLVGLCGLGWAAPAVAQETIVDPENPATSPDEEGDEEEESEEGGTETIVDPENPASDGDDGDDGADDENEDDKPVDDRVDFLSRYDTRLAIDTAWEGDDEDVVEWSTLYRLGIDYEAADGLRASVEGEFWHWIAGK
ncbi:MAG: hypothetical protein ACOCV2_06375, partial [Persicimonas sp.]